MSVDLIKKQVYNLNAEQKLLGIMVLNNETVAQITQTISSDDFSIIAHREIFNLIVTLINNKQRCSKSVITAILKQNKILANIGGIEYLSNLLNVLPTSKNATYYAQIIKIQSLSYKLLDLAHEFGNNQTIPPAIAEILSKITNEISIKTPPIETTNFYLKVTNLVKVIFSYLEQCSDNQLVVSKVS